MSDITENTAVPSVPSAENTAEEVGGAASRHRRQLMGQVVSTKGEKTAVVSVTRTFLHPQYRKYVRRSKKYMTHDEHNTCGEGDQVLIEECRPMSKHKRWRLRSVLRKNI